MFYLCVMWFVCWQCTRGEGESGGSSSASGYQAGSDNDHYYYGTEMGEAQEDTQEENEIAFFDNNVEKSAPSFSLLDTPGRKHTSTPVAADKGEKRRMGQGGERRRRAGDVRGKNTRVTTSAAATSVPASDPASSPPTPLDTPHQEQPLNRESRRDSPTTATGPAVGLTDESLITMLGQPPKAVPLLRTKTGFQEFFRGISRDRMRRLLQSAYADLNQLERDAKVRKRMELLGDVLAATS